MTKLADPNLRLRCVACQSTETPLWRAGPDGPKTLCNACGVRYKKGKLVLYKDDNGNLTAVPRHDAQPVHVPPAPKKATKKSSSPSNAAPSSPTDPPTKRAPVRKVPSEGTIATAVGKKPRSRSRRTNAGQMPGRYASKTLPDSLNHWRSPQGSPNSSPSTPVASPRFPGTSIVSFSLQFSEFVQPNKSFDVESVTDISSNYDQSFSCENDDHLAFIHIACNADENTSNPLLGFSCNPGPFHVDTSSMYQLTDPEDESIFPNMACLGLDCSADPDNLTLLPMPADPSSVEQFSFAFSGLGRDVGIEIDKPDRVEALRSLLVDRTRKVSRTYESTVQSLTRLCEQRYLKAKQTNAFAKVSIIDDCRNFVRAFAHEQSVGFSLHDLGDLQGGLADGLSFGELSPGVMLSEKTAQSSAVENFKALMDSTELAGFAEACMVELLTEDVVAALAQNGYMEFENGSGCRVPDSGLASKPIPTPA